MNEKEELIQLCLIFLKYISAKYIKGEITKEEYNDFKSSKIKFLRDCGVDL